MFASIKLPPVSINLNNIQLLCHECFLANGSPTLLNQLTPYLGNYFKFKEFGSLVKINKELMICFVHIAKKAIVEDCFFQGEHTIVINEKEEIANMIHFLSSNFGFDNEQSLNIYVDFLGFLVKQYILFPHSLIQEAEKLMKLFDNYPLIYQFKILSSIFDGLAQLNNGYVKYGNSSHILMVFLRKYGNFLIYHVEKNCHQQFEKKQELKQFLEMLDCFLSMVSANNDLLLANRFQINYNILDWNNVNLNQWVQFLSSSWFSTGKQQISLKERILLTLQKLVGVSVTKKDEKKQERQMILIETVSRILDLEEMSAQINEALIFLMEGMVKSFKTLSMTTFFERCPKLLPFCRYIIANSQLGVYEGINSVVCRAFSIFQNFVVYEEVFKNVQIKKQEYITDVFDIFLMRLMKQYNQFQFASLTDNIEMLSDYFKPFAHMIFFYGNSEINLIRKLFEQTKNDTNFVVANLIGNCLLMEDFKYENYTDTEEQEKYLQTFRVQLALIAHEFFDNIDKVACPFSQMYIVKVFFKLIIGKNFIEQGEISSHTYLILQRQECLEFEFLILAGIRVLEKCVQYFNSNIENYERCQEYINFALQICLDVCKKLAGRHRYVTLELEDHSEEENFVQVIECIYDTLDAIHIEKESPKNIEKHYEMWGILLNEYDKCTLYDVETKLSQDFCVDNEIGLMKYMAGATGILKGLKVQSYFKLFCQLLLQKFSKIHLDPQNEKFLEIFIEFMKQLTYDRDSQRNCEKGIRIQQIFHTYLQKVLPIAIEVPELYKATISIYENYARIEGVHYLLPLPPFKKGRIEKRLLCLYFERLPRVENISSLEHHTIASLTWMNLYLEQKIERQETLSENFFDLPFYFGIANYEKINHLKNLLATFVGSKENVLHETQGHLIEKVWIEKRMI